MDKRSLTERDICTKFILPAIKHAGWDEMVQVSTNAKTIERQDGIDANDLTFVLPPGWAWARLGTLIDLISGQHLQPPKYSEDLLEALLHEALAPSKNVMEAAE